MSAELITLLLQQCCDCPAMVAYRKRSFQVKLLGGRELLADGVGHKALHGSCEAVWAQGAEDEQALKLWHALPVARQRLVLRPFQLHPLLPPLGTAHQVIRQSSIVLQLLLMQRQLSES